MVESLALSTEASHDNTGLEFSFAFSVNPEVLSCARRWGDPMDKLRAISTALLDQVCASDARKQVADSCAGEDHLSANRSLIKCRRELNLNRSYRPFRSAGLYPAER